MRGWFVGLLLLAGCAGKQTYSVVWPDKSQDRPLWACLKDPDDASQIVCLDFERALNLLGSQETSSPGESLPTFQSEPRTEFEL